MESSLLTWKHLHRTAPSERFLAQRERRDAATIDLQSFPNYDPLALLGSGPLTPPNT